MHGICQIETSVSPRARKTKSDKPNYQGPPMSYVRTPEHRAFTGSPNSSLEAVGEIDRAKIARG